MSWIETLKHDIGTRALQDLIQELPLEDHCLISLFGRTILLLDDVLALLADQGYEDAMLLQDVEAAQGLFKELTEGYSNKTS